MPLLKKFLKWRDLAGRYADHTGGNLCPYNIERANRALYFYTYTYQTNVFKGGNPCNKDDGFPEISFFCSWGR